MRIPSSQLRPFFLACLLSVRLGGANTFNNSKEELPFGYFDRLLSIESNRATYVKRSGNVDVVVISNNSGGLRNGTGDERRQYGRCHLVSLHCFSVKQNGTLLSLGEDPYKDHAATILAMHHFNTGNGQVVKELEGIDKRCNIRFTTESVIDTQCSIFRGLKELTDVVTRDPRSSLSKMEDDPRQAPEPQPCAILGASRSAVTQATTTLSSVHGLVQMSYRSSSPTLSTERDQFPLFSRVIPSGDASAALAVSYLSKRTNARHVAVIFVDDAFGNSYQKALKKEALLHHDSRILEVRTFPIPVDPTEAEVDFALNLVRSTGYRYILGVISTFLYDRVMTRAFHCGIVGREYSWLFPGGGALKTYLHGRTIPVNSPLDVATRGIGILDARGGHPGYGRYDAFLQSWQSLKQEDLDFINAFMPVNDRIAGQKSVNSANSSSENDNSVEHFRSDNLQYFLNTDPGIIAPFAYDTVVAMGLAACLAEGADTASSGNRLNRNDGSEAESLAASTTYFDGSQHVHAIKHATTFEGATGVIRIDPETSSRTATSTFYVLFNLIRTEKKEAKDSDGKYGQSQPIVAAFSAIESKLAVPRENQSYWLVEHKEPFIYADGTTTPPDDLPPQNENRNYLGNLVILGYFLCAFVLFLSLVFGSWTFFHRNVRVVKASQPLFLIMICTGTILMGSSIIPLSMDDEHHSQEGLNAACMAVPWLLSIGFVISFSALFSKTWRVNKIFHNPSRFQRIKVTERDVIYPFVVLMIANVAVLTSWTILAPLTFVRYDYPGTDIYGRTVASFGVCGSPGDHPGGGMIPFITLNALIDFLAVLLANIQAYQARNIKVEYSESRYIAIIMGSLLQVWCIGIPVMALVWNQPKAFYMIKVFIVFFTCLAIQLFIFVPKVIFLKKYREERTKKEAERAERRAMAAATAATADAEFSIQSSVDDGSAGLCVAVVSSTIEHAQQHRQDQKPLDDRLNGVAEGERMEENEKCFSSS